MRACTHMCSYVPSNKRTPANPHLHQSCPCASLQLQPNPLSFRPSPAGTAPGAAQGPFPASMLPMRIDPDRVHNFLVPGDYAIRLLVACKALIFYTYNKDNEVGVGWVHRTWQGAPHMGRVCRTWAGCAAHGLGTPHMGWVRRAWAGCAAHGQGAPHMAGCIAHGWVRRTWLCRDST